MKAFTFIIRVLGRAFRRTFRSETRERAQEQAEAVARVEEARESGVERIVVGHGEDES